MKTEKFGKKIELDSYENINGDTIKITAYIGRKGDGWSQTADIMVEKTYENKGEVIYAEVLYSYDKENR